MSNLVLTEKQEQFVLNYVYHVMVEEFDRYPSDVVNDENERYKGDWHKYARDMAKWHNIRFCAHCNKGIIGTNINNKSTDLCNDCFVLVKTS